ncbi:MAG TPA: rhodanese-like domain-containing protein [Actinomycetota bacterium]|nr:rhodanese-like domain-containing protein [Actinomycetota bacterium]
MQRSKILEEARREVPEIGPSDAKKEIDEGKVAVLLDVREMHEWRKGHIEGAVLIPMDEVPEVANPTGPEPDPRLTEHSDDRIIVYCDAGVRSLLAAHELKKLGYGNVASMAGGIGVWTKEGNPVEK